MATIRVRESGVRAADLEAQRAALIEFAAQMYRPLVRCDQRRKGEQYVRGLLLEGKRKSIQPMAARLADGDEEGLQNFICDSPWDDVPVRRRLAVRMDREIEPGGWVVDDTGLPKDGRLAARHVPAGRQEIRQARRSCRGRRQSRSARTAAHRCSC
jgi:SRSO17 transposase